MRRTRWPERGGATRPALFHALQLLPVLLVAPISVSAVLWLLEIPVGIVIAAVIVAVIVGMVVAIVVVIVFSVSIMVAPIMAIPVKAPLTEGLVR